MPLKIGGVDSSRSLVPQTKYKNVPNGLSSDCLLYTSDAADERSSVDLGGRRIINKKNSSHSRRPTLTSTHNNAQFTQSVSH